MGGLEHLALGAWALGFADALGVCGAWFVLWGLVVFWRFGGCFVFVFFGGGGGVVTVWTVQVCMLAHPPCKTLTKARAFLDVSFFRVCVCEC